jgi:hypothetical protein
VSIADVAASLFPATPKVNMVRLVDGNEVDSCSEAWRAECEARVILGWEPIQQREFFEKIDAPGKRGPGSSDKIKALMRIIEPYYVLDYFATKPAREAYLDKVEKNVGYRSRQLLREEMLDIFHKRQAALATTSQHEA